MLTKSDLQQIGTLIDSKLESKLEDKFDKKLKPIHTALKKMSKDINIIITTFDRLYLSHEKRITKVEKHQGISDVGTN